MLSRAGRERTHMTEHAATLGELILDLLGLLGVIALTLVAAYVGFKMLGRLIWRSQRERISTCASHIATALSLTGAAPPDPCNPRMQLWQGRMPGGELWLATGAMHYGPTGLQQDRCGPGFIKGAPQFSFEHLGSLMVIARFLTPLPVQFTLTTGYGVIAHLETGDSRFDQTFKLNAAQGDDIRRLFSSASLRDALLAIFGPDRERTGIGMSVSVNECGLVAYWSSPNPDRAADFGRAVAVAVDRLSGFREPWPVGTLRRDC